MHSTDYVDDKYIGSGKRLWYSINKYGIENHKIERLEFFETREELKNREKEIVNEELLENLMCMNLIVGGGGYNNGFTKINLDNKSQKIKSDKANQKLKWLFENDKEWYLARNKKISEKTKGIKKWLGKKHTQETIEKMSISHKGKNKHNSNFRWVSNKNESKKIYIKELDFYLNSGWIRGRRKIAL
jgi:hypothetical protein